MKSKESRDIIVTQKMINAGNYAYYIATQGVIVSDVLIKVYAAMEQARRDEKGE